MKQIGEAVTVIAVVMAMFACMWGWVLNIIKLCSADGMGGMEMARAVGIFVAPLGAVLGWF